MNLFGSGARKSRRRSGGQELSIYDCLRRFTKEEQLDAENMWKCDKCGVKNRAFKQMVIAEAPQVRRAVRLPRSVEIEEGISRRAPLHVILPPFMSWSC